MTKGSVTQSRSSRRIHDPSCAIPGERAITSIDRVRHHCECCGTQDRVRKQSAPRCGYRCHRCRDDHQLMRLVRAAWPLLMEKRPGEAVYGTPPVTIHRLQSLFKTHPELHRFLADGYKQVALKAIETLFLNGAVEEEVVRACGITLFQLRTFMKRRPDLRHQANQNSIRRFLEQMTPVFDLVERDGHTIWSACRMMGIRGVNAAYRVARSDLAKERYPSLMVKSIDK